MLIQSKESFPLKGVWRGHQTELDFKRDPISGLLMPIDTGFIIKDTVKDGENTLTTKFKAYLMNKMVDDGSNDYAMDSRFAVEGLVAGNDEKGGIVSSSANGSSGALTAGQLHRIFITTLNDGGDNAEVYFELYGYSTGAQTFDAFLCMVQGYENDDDTVDHVFAYVGIDEEIAANRRYHHYWKITAS